MRTARRLLVAFVIPLVVAGCGSAEPPTPAAPSTPAEPSTSIAPSTPPDGSGALSSEVRVFFVGGGMDPCGGVAPVVRRVAGRVDAAVALRELLRGPTEQETAAGYTSLFGPATADALIGVDVIDGIAHVAFVDLRPLLPNASSSCGSAALLGALDATLAQLPGIRGARYSFGGDETEFYEWLQVAPPD